MTGIENKLHDLIEESCKQCKSNTIAMSGGLDSTIIAYNLKERISNATAIIAEDFVATDLTYCQLAAKKFNIPLSIQKMTVLEIISGIEETIKILKNFNDIEIRNNVVMYLLMNHLKKQGKDSIITGDGADELFAGYHFLKNKSEAELETELERIRKIMHFPTQKIGKSLGIKVESPFLRKDVIEFSKNIPVKFKVKRQEDKIFGKWILRKAFENEIPSQIIWREKSPMQEGSGTAGLTELFNTLITDSVFEQRKKEIKEDDGVIIRTKESLQYYNIFRKQFGTLPRNQHSESYCPFCKFNVELNSKFCRMCGAFPI